MDMQIHSLLIFRVLHIGTQKLQLLLTRFLIKKAEDLCRQLGLLICFAGDMSGEKVREINRIYGEMKNNEIHLFHSVPNLFYGGFFTAHHKQDR